MRILTNSYLPNKNIILYILFSAIIALYLLADTFGAKWSIYGDHELISYQVAKKIYNYGFFDILLDTEVGKPFDESRYRPTTYILYILESYIADSNPLILNLNRLLIVFTFIFLLCLMIKKRSGLNHLDSISVELIK